MGKRVRAAILGNCTTDYVAGALARACSSHQIEAEVYNGPFRQYNQLIYNRDSEFYRFDPEITILFLEGSILFPEWYEVGRILDSPEKKNASVQGVFEALISLVEEIHKNAATKVILNNFKVPYFSPLGIMDHKYYPGLKDQIALLNLKLSEWASDKDYVFIFDYCAFASLYGNRSIEDAKMYYILNTTVSLRYTDALAKEYLRYILPLKCMTKKCLVLDLDQTLWGGVAGEDGISGIKLDLSGPGRSFYDFQKEILNLYEKGVLLAVCSKNNPEDVLEILEQHPHMLLKKEHFSVMKINWQDKAANIREIAKELNIGLDAIVFFDDSVVERELVKSLLPEVTVIDVPADTSKYVRTIRSLIEFEQMKLTSEDLNRNAMYAKSKERAAARGRFHTVEEYLKSLGTKMTLAFSNEFSIPRIAQLTQKTNQFNMTTKRYSLEEIKRFHDSPDHLVVSCQITDIYGDSGITGVCIVEQKDETAWIDTFLLSCRILGRRAEYAFLSEIVSLLRDKGIKTIYAKYIKTEKNREHAGFYQNAGFSVLSETESETEFCLGESGRLVQAEEIEVIVKGETKYG